MGCLFLIISFVLCSVDRVKKNNFAHANSFSDFEQQLGKNIVTLLLYFAASRNKYLKILCPNMMCSLISHLNKHSNLILTIAESNTTMFFIRGIRILIGSPFYFKLDLQVEQNPLWNCLSLAESTLKTIHRGIT